MKIKSIDDLVSLYKKEAPKIWACLVIGASLTLHGCNLNTIPIPREYNSWHYQLQNAQYSNLNKLSVEALVVDFEDAKLTPTDISDLRSNHKVIFSYLSIGAAENYRSYWQSDWRVGYPSFIDEEIPDWKGNFIVHYWDPDWQSIMLSKVQEIAHDGYDGIYLDMIDSYYYYETKGRSTAAAEMINFVHEIRDIAKTINPTFLIIPQNAPELYDNDDYKQIIDGFGKEDTWYYDNKVRSKSDINYELTYLDQAVRDGKFVLAIDYPTAKNKIHNFYSKCEQHGFTGTVSDRELNLNRPIR